MFFIAFVFEVFGLRKKGPHESGGDALIINGVVLFIILAVSSFNMDLIPTLPIIGSAENLLLLVGVVFVLAIFWAAYKTTDKPNSKQ
jgi:cbb3-type cytochrome oxidase subunit 3